MVVVRELRLLLGLLVVLFMTSETWRYVGRLTGPRLAAVVVALLGASMLVVVVGLRRVYADSLRREDVRRAVVRVAGEVVAFAAALLVGFGLVGVVTIDAGLVAEWTSGSSEVVVSLDLGQPPLVLTRPLLQVSAFLAALGALAFAVEAISDPDTRLTLLRDLAEPDDGARHRLEPSPR
jgi:hypothetical protein